MFQFFFFQTRNSNRQVYAPSYSSVVRAGLKVKLVLHTILCGTYFVLNCRTRTVDVALYKLFRYYIIIIFDGKKLRRAGCR